MHFTKALLFLITLFLFGSLHGQTINDYYQKEQYEELVKYARTQNQNNLTAKECYMVGYAQFRLGNDFDAVGWYEKANRKGMETSYLYFYKGIAYRYNKQYDRSMKSFLVATKKEPHNQEYFAEMSATLIEMDLPDSALSVIKEALKMQATYPKIYYLRGLAFTKKEKWDDALAAFKLAVENIKKGDTYYVQSLIETGRICYSKKKDYICALNAYDEAVKLRPNDYTLYRSMIKACYATEKWEQADSFFVRMKKAYHMGELSDELAKWKGVPVEEFTVEDYQVLVIRHFDEPNQAGFAPYLFYVTVNKGLIIDRKVSYQLTMGPKGKLDILRLTAQYPDKFEDYELEFPLDAPYHDLREKVRGILQGIVHPRRTVPIKENK